MNCSIMDWVLRLLLLQNTAALRMAVVERMDHAMGKILIVKLWVIFALVLLLCSRFGLAGFSGGERESLMKLKEFLDPSHKNTVLQKKWTSLHCYKNISRWPGISCTDGRATGLVLENMGLDGSIPEDSLVHITELRIISFRNNCLTGRIPSSLLGLNHLEKLDLQNNKFIGSIPSFNQRNLKAFNVSYNNLTGAIPDTPVMKSVEESAFWGNGLQCGKIVFRGCVEKAVATQRDSPSKKHSIESVEKAVATPQDSPSKKRSIPSGIIILIALLGASGLLVIVLVAASCYRRYKPRNKANIEIPKTLPGSNKKRAPVVSNKNPPAASRKKASHGAPPAGQVAERKRVGAHDELYASSLETVPEEERGKLSFLSDDVGTFNMEDLLQASADFISKGNFGSAYKAVLRNGAALVVKRLRELSNVSIEEFEKRMMIIGKLRHENLVPLISYYSAEEEKLLIYKFMPNGNLFDLIHARREGGGRSLDWKSRLRIAQSVGRGLAYLHQNWGSQRFIPHGNLKSSNILLDENRQPRISDYALCSLLFPRAIVKHMVAFKSPEYLQTKRVSYKSDVWSFGIILLELLTGKVPSHGGCTGTGIDLPDFVRTIVREEWTGEIFDREIAWQESTQSQMLKMLQIAIDCTSTGPERRPPMNAVLKRLEDIKESDLDEEMSCSEDDYSVDYAAAETSESSSSVYSQSLGTRI